MSHVSPAISTIHNKTPISVLKLQVPEGSKWRAAPVGVAPVRVLKRQVVIIAEAERRVGRRLSLMMKDVQK